MKSPDITAKGIEVMQELLEYLDNPLEIIEDGSNEEQEVHKFPITSWEILRQLVREKKNDLLVNVIGKFPNEGKISEDAIYADNSTITKSLLNTLIREGMVVEKTYYKLTMKANGLYHNSKKV